MLKECLDIEKDFNEFCKVYDIGAKDVFGKKFYIVKNELGYIKFYSKYSDYKKRRKILDKKKLQHVIIQKYGKVIDITQNTYNKIQKCFPDSKLPCRELINIYE